MAKANQTGSKSIEHRRSEEDVFKETIAALDRFNQYMLEAGYKISKDVMAKTTLVNNPSVKQTNSSKKLKKVA